MSIADCTCSSEELQIGDTMSNLTNGGRFPAPSKPPTMTPNGSNNSSNIPLRRQNLNRTNSNSSQHSNNSSTTPSKIPVNASADALKWKQKCDEVEQKRKAILIEKEKMARQFNELQKKHLDLQIKNEQLETELFEKNEEFTKLTTVSKTLYKEYETLKNQYETETGAMARALKDASQWYQENKELKRKTMLLMDRDTVDEGVDAGDCIGDSDIENLNKTIKHLSSEVAELQTELDALKHVEFQTSEQNVKLSDDLEAERDRNHLLEQEMAELRKEHSQMMRVSELMKKELQDLQRIEEDQRNNVVSLRREADDYKKERNILAHQSTLLLQGLNNDDGNDCMVLLQEVERLKRTIEEERNKHEEEIASLQDKLEELENNAQVEVLEERLKLVESELAEALQRAEKAEEALKAPPAPPPPPPPPLLPSNSPPVVPLRVKRRSRVNVLELADAIGVQESTPDSKKPGVNDDIINAIKEGKFTLKKAKNESKKEREGPKAVSELLNILGNLRRAPKKRQSQIIADVQL